jgi:hypothetical protein
MESKVSTNNQAATDEGRFERGRGLQKRTSLYKISRGCGNLGSNQAKLGIRLMSIETLLCETYLELLKRHEFVRSVLKAVKTTRIRET